MGFFSKDINTLNDLFLHTMRHIYYAEKKIAKALPNMVDKATDNGLKDGLERHLDETEIHIERLEKAFEMLGAEARAVNCPAIEGIIDEADEVSGDIDDDMVMDAALIAAAQAVPGVTSVHVTRFGRQGGRDNQPLNTAKLELGRLEIARCDNDPNFAEHGLFNLSVGGGK